MDARRTDLIKLEKTVEEELRVLRGRSTPGVNDRVGSLTVILLIFYKDTCPLTYP